MIVTCPTCQAERSPLKASALLNTAPHSNKEKSKDKNGLKKKKERAMFKNTISQHKRRRKIDTAKKTPDLGERRKEERE
jgi:hypothetical protein